MLKLLGHRPAIDRKPRDLPGWIMGRQGGSRGPRSGLWVLWMDLGRFLFAKGSEMALEANESHLRPYNTPEEVSMRLLEGFCRRFQKVYIPHWPSAKTLAKHQAVISMFVTFVCVYIHVYVERHMWRAPKRPRETHGRSREPQRGPKSVNRHYSRIVFRTVTHWINDDALKLLCTQNYPSIDLCKQAPLVAKVLFDHATTGNKENLIVDTRNIVSNDSDHDQDVCRMQDDCV